MKDATPKAIYLKDYTPPAFLIEQVDLTFELDDDKTLVRNQLTLRRNPNAAQAEKDLRLEGKELILESVSLNGTELDERGYQVGKEQLTVKDVPDSFTLTICNTIAPSKNTALEGLYKSSSMLCTQCEAEGFRRITYFLDRPDVMADYSTTMIGSAEKYPVMLSNGNPVERGTLEDGRSWVKWVDPFKKPSYLFALVAGDLVAIEDHYTTASGRDVLLQIFVEKQNQDKCAHAMESLKQSMRWDEETYGREYDLDIYMIVAVDDFNMGAMENKGLNIFNSSCVLAKPETATDGDYKAIQGIIGHEYFHNWTGNRITCRDWFQLSLKEGLTVFRDQEFSSDLNSRPVKRISDVNMLRTGQFPEDAGPQAHPVRPDSYIDISNFYTRTVYEKGAEVIRMMHTLLGAEGFRRGMDLYFERHDGQAVTTDDFVKSMEDANSIDFSQFRLWYSQAGTPKIEVRSEYNAPAQEHTLHFKQSLAPTPGQSEKAAMPIPIKFSLLDDQGSTISIQSETPLQGQQSDEKVFVLKDQEASLTMRQVASRPVPSILRGFSAPVNLETDLSDDDLYFLMAHDNDAFNRWQAMQTLSTQLILGLVKRIQDNASLSIPSEFIDAVGKTLTHTSLDKDFIAMALNLPNEILLAEAMDVIDPDAIHQAREFVKKELASNLSEAFFDVYAKNQSDAAYTFNANAVGQRSLKNSCLDYLVASGSDKAIDLVRQQYENSNNMTDGLAALNTVASIDLPIRKQLLNDFYQKWQHDNLVINKWLALQARASLPNNIATVKELMAHEAFEMKNPNKVRALIGVFCMANPVNFHQKDGSGYRFLADQVITLNTLNPQIGSRLAAGFNRWRKFDSARQALMTSELKRILACDNLEKDVYEIVSKALG